MKKFFKKILVYILGFHNFLLFTSLFRVLTLRLKPSEREFFYFLSLIPPDSTILDIGANIGYKVYFFSKVSGSTVFAFEPARDNNKALNKIIALFKLKNVSMFPFALGNKNSVVEMIMPVIDKVHEHAYCYVTENSDDRNGIRFSVPIKRVDDIEEIKNCIKPVKALKIDVEGHELFVLNGAIGLIHKFKPIIFCEVQNNNRESVFDLMRSLGYKIMKYTSRKLVLITSDINLSGDFFFIPD